MQLSAKELLFKFTSKLENIQSLTTLGEKKDDTKRHSQVTRKKFSMLSLSNFLGNIKRKFFRIATAIDKEIRIIFYTEHTFYVKGKLKSV